MIMEICFRLIHTSIQLGTGKLFFLQRYLKFQVEGSTLILNRLFFFSKVISTLQNT